MSDQYRPNEFARTRYEHSEPGGSGRPRRGAARVHETFGEIGGIPEPEFAGACIGFRAVETANRALACVARVVAGRGWSFVGFRRTAVSASAQIADSGMAGRVGRSAARSARMSTNRGCWPMRGAEHVEARVVPRRIGGAVMDVAAGVSEAPRRDEWHREDDGGCRTIRPQA